MKDKKTRTTIGDLICMNCSGVGTVIDDCGFPDDPVNWVTTTCPDCKGTGIVKSAEDVSLSK